MPMTLNGSCQCGAVEFTVESHTPVPYQICACSICRKVGGYNGSCNLGAVADSLKITKGINQIKYVNILLSAAWILDQPTRGSHADLNCVQKVHSNQGPWQTHGGKMHISAFLLRRLLYHALAVGLSLA